MKTYHSSRKSFCYLLGVIVLAMLGAYGYFRVYAYRAETKTLQAKQEQIATTQQVLESKGAEEDFIKLALARNIEQEQTKIKRAEHIKLLIQIIQEIQDTNYVGSNAITLSDFQVDTEKLSLKGKVTNLILLYHSLPERNYISLIDRFVNLDFTESVSIKEYQKVGDIIEFTLHADIALNDDQQ